MIRFEDLIEKVRTTNPDEAFMAMRRLLRSSKGDVSDAIWVARKENEGVA